MYSFLTTTACYALVLGVVAITYFSDLKQAVGSTDTMPAYCIEFGPDYSQEKCLKIKRWWRLEEEIFIRKSFLNHSCNCPKEKETEELEEKVGRQFCEEVCNQTDHGLEAAFRKYCHPESSDFSKKICEDDQIYKWLTKARESIKKQKEEENKKKKKRKNFLF